MKHCGFCRLWFKSSFIRFLVSIRTDRDACRNLHYWYQFSITFEADLLHELSLYICQVSPSYCVTTKFWRSGFRSCRGSCRYINAPSWDISSGSIKAHIHNASLLCITKQSVLYCTEGPFHSNTKLTDPTLQFQNAVACEHGRRIRNR